ncbi:hypothetical protein [Paraburkholderia domus]|uniref:hypothetical protein n=1 Tax=Paraburkholderia domus TaxID=2793075 RepID=UPI001911AA00|nr:hypothetical protein [Paraburkholderia domus]MBK5061742.1 hypothetical protein [Burkholderia sp. R-70199]CAE6899616.1 hypothetical protein R70199_03615 [Paraburkholderia domus]
MLKSAWLITLEFAGPKRKPEIVSILNGRTGAGRVKDLVEQIYADRFLSAEERISRIRERANMAYRADIDIVQRITCGHNPFLYARHVNNLKAAQDTGEDIAFTWDERDWEAIRKRLGI